MKNSSVLAPCIACLMAVVLALSCLVSRERQSGVGLLDTRVNTPLDDRALSLAKQAEKAAAEGRIDEARLYFARATDGTSNLAVLNLAYKFYA